MSEIVLETMNNHFGTTLRFLSHIHAHDTVKKLYSLQY